MPENRSGFPSIISMVAPDKPAGAVRAIFDDLRRENACVQSIDGTASHVALFGLPPEKRTQWYQDPAYERARGCTLVVDRAENLHPQTYEEIGKHDGPTKVVLLYSENPFPDVRGLGHHPELPRILPKLQQHPSWEWIAKNAGLEAAGEKRPRKAATRKKRS